MKIIFMGTPEFAMPTLEALSTQHEVIAVYTQAPKPAGRGQKETLSAIHELAIKLNLPIYTPKSLRKLEAQEEFVALKADVTVVVAYGLILPKEIIEGCPYGCINIHPSLLPYYRGAAPLQRTIMANEKETAMCIMQMDEGVDTGDILTIEKIDLDNHITYEELSNEMAQLGAKLLLETLSSLDKIIPQKQEGLGSYANKILKEEGELKWSEDAIVLMNKVRALNPSPGTFFYANNEKIKVTKAKIYNENHQYKPGTITDYKNFIIACKNGFIQPLVLQRPGKKSIALREFMNGYKLSVDTIL